MGSLSEKPFHGSRCFIFTGQTGVNHRQVAERLALFVADREGLPQAVNNPDVKKRISIYCVEDELLDRPGGDITVFLDSYNEEKLERKWTEALKRVRNKIEAEEPQNAVISMHTTFHRFGRIFSPLNWELIKQLQPVRFVTLIDDIYSIWHRVCWREQHLAVTGSYFRLRELATWRSIEMLMTDCLAKYVDPDVRPVKRNFVLGIKHPTAMLYKLLFEPERLIIYIGFHITDTREDPKMRQEIDSFRWTMHDQFTVFDPLAIDEKILEFLYERQTGHSPLDNFVPPAEMELNIQEQDRWRMHSDPRCLLTDEGQRESGEHGGFPISLPALEVKEVAGDLTHQIQMRDYRLIEQSDHVVHYRPQYGGRASSGVSSEIQYARETAFVPLAAVFPDSDGSPEQTFFARPRKLFQSTEELMVDLEKSQEEKSRSIRGGEKTSDNLDENPNKEV